MIRLLAQLVRRILVLVRGRISPADTGVPLQTAPPVNLDLDKFTRGIDNVHVDVRLSPTFMNAAARLVIGLLEYQLWRGQGGSKSPDGEEMKNAYSLMIQAAIHRAKQQSALPLVELAQLAALKFILNYVQVALEQAKQRLRKAATTATDADRQAVAEQTVWFTRNRARLHYTVSSQVMDHIRKMEAGPLGDLRHSLHGDRWTLPEHMLINPLLFGESPMDDDLLMKHYVFVGQGPDQLYSFAQLDRFLLYLFWRRKPVTASEQALARATQEREALIAEQNRAKKKRGWTQSPTKTGQFDSQVAALEEKIREATAVLGQAQAAYAQESYAWADTPANAEVLFDLGQSQQRLLAAQKAKDQQAAAAWRQQQQFQRRLLRAVELQMEDSGLVLPIVAAYETAAVMKNLVGVVSAQQLHQYLSSPASRSEIRQKVKEKFSSADCAETFEMMDEAATRVARYCGNGSRAYLVRFLRDFLTLRRDLRGYHLVQKAMAQIQLLEDPNHLKLSKANNTLNEFLAAKEEGAVSKTIIGHTILKADVRGSTTITAALRKQGLNPASHFSLNFFSPINALLETYGAGKVFIEGDAVILSIMEYAEASEQHMSVARACGLAKRLLEVVQLQNVACRKAGLPELELGIGLVYSAEPPAYLFDGETPIMISSAIGKADRTSSCSWMLRKQRNRQGAQATSQLNVDVYEIPEGDPLRGEKGEVELRYNVNGIELDATGFAKLKQEIALQSFDMPVVGTSEPVTFYAGRFPDTKGTMHRLVVREGRIKFFDRQSDNGGKENGQVFYEVVGNDQLITAATEMLKMETTAMNMPAFGFKPSQAPRS
jgi:hypothetical protein